MLDTSFSTMKTLVEILNWSGLLDFQNQQCACLGSSQRLNFSEIEFLSRKETEDFLAKPERRGKFSPEFYQRLTRTLGKGRAGDLERSGGREMF